MLMENKMEKFTNSQQMLMWIVAIIVIGSNGFFVVRCSDNYFNTPAQQTLAEAIEACNASVPSVTFKVEKWDDINKMVVTIDQTVSQIIQACHKEAIEKYEFAKVPTGEGN
jgi:hypothetical protein